MKENLTQKRVSSFGAIIKTELNSNSRIFGKSANMSNNTNMAYFCQCKFYEQTGWKFNVSEYFKHTGSHNDI